MEERLHLSDSEIPKDLRGFRTPLDSLTNFTTGAMVEFRGLGFYQERGYKTAMLALTDIVLFHAKVGPLEGLTDETQAVTDRESVGETDSLPPWLYRPNDYDEGGN